MLTLRNIFLSLYFCITASYSFADNIFTIVDMSGGNIIHGSKVRSGSNIYLQAWSMDKLYNKLDFSISHECESFLTELYPHANQEDNQETLLDLTILLEKQSFKSLELPREFFVHEVTNERVLVESIKEGVHKGHLIINGKINYKDITVLLIIRNDGIRISLFDGVLSESDTNGSTAAIVYVDKVIDIKDVNTSTTLSYLNKWGLPRTALKMTSLISSVYLIAYGINGWGWLLFVTLLL